MAARAEGLGGRSECENLGFESAPDASGGLRVPALDCAQPPSQFRAGMNVRCGNYAAMYTACDCVTRNAQNCG